MKKRILIATLSLVTLFGSALYVAAAPPGGPCDGPCNGRCDGLRDGKGQHGGRFLERMSKILDLTEAQQAGIKQVQAAEEEKIAALYEKKQEIRQQLHQAGTVKPFDENAIRVLAEQRGALAAELTIVRARMHRQIDDLLTPEQREIAAKLRSERGEKHKGRKGGHR